MVYLIDLFVLLFILMVAYLGYKKGLVGVAFKIFSFFIAIILALILFHPVSTFIINNTTLDDKINTYVSDKVNEEMSTNSENNNDNSDSEKKSSNLPKSISSYINKSISDTTKSIQNNIAETVSNNITKSIVNIISFIVVFIISRILLLFIRFLSDWIANLPILKQFNEIGGLLYGILKAFLILFICLALISVLPLYNIQNTISNTYITLFLYNINPILWFFI